MPFSANNQWQRALGNRAPLGAGSIRALETGLGEDTSWRAFLDHYYAIARGLVVQSRQIKDHLNAHGYAVDRMLPPPNRQTADQCRS